MATNSWDELTNDEKIDRLPDVLTRAGSETMNLIKRLFLKSCERGASHKTRSFLILSLTTLMMLVSTQMVYAKDECIKFSDFDDHTAIIYAHQDDDLLWMLPWWPKCNRFVIGGLPTTNGGRNSDGYIGLIDRQQDFLDQQQEPIHYRDFWRHPWDPPITDLQYVNYYWNGGASPGDYLLNGWDESEPLITRNQVDRIKEHIRDYFEDHSISRIVTHNNWGEYGHPHHRAVNQACRELGVEYGKDVWVLGSKVSASTHTFHDLVSCDLPCTVADFPPDDLFNHIRQLYINFVIDPPLNRNAWTWCKPPDNPCEDPSATPRPYLKVVDGTLRRDLSAASKCLRNAYNAVLIPTTTMIEAPLFTRPNFVMGDFNGDGQPDFAGPYPDQSIWVRYSSPSPVQPTWSELNGQLDVLVTGHFNTEHDGRTHLAGVNKINGSIWYTTDLTNPGSVPWTSIPGYLTSLVAGDFNADGVTDLAGIDGPNREVWYTTDLGSHWHQIQGSLDSLVVGDFNGDGTSDLAGIDYTTHTVKYTTDRTAFQSLNVQGVSSIAAGNFNDVGDGPRSGAGLPPHRPDGLAIIRSYNVYYTKSLVDDPVVWQLIGHPSTDQFTRHLGVGDLDGDGRDDVVGLRAGGSTILKTTDLTHWDEVPSPSLESIVVGDFNHDGRADIVGTNNAADIWYLPNLEANWEKIDND